MICHNGYIDLQQIAFETFIKIVKACSDSYNFNLIWEYIYYLYDSGESSCFQLEGNELSFSYAYLGEETPSTPSVVAASLKDVLPKPNEETNGKMKNLKRMLKKNQKRMMELKKNQKKNQKKKLKKKQ
eukprot:CAMPEP_0117420114 /NCGR_PEP_ID=MMETSP0758-20121206/1520_1 /TAXON_ID=63605 /ORGANISM="Percolomonas cosmopolitus, Strain AE-1 (ATCC 50343)" /LENGTH=127 /DNA_ID=CAMNT_0005201543 /DNA_START=873 /DNA_END=1253 /DNA_ORIENTATION=-